MAVFVAQGSSRAKERIRAQLHPTPRAPASDPVRHCRKSSLSLWCRSCSSSSAFLWASPWTPRTFSSHPRVSHPRAVSAACPCSRGLSWHPPRGGVAQNAFLCPLHPAWPGGLHSAHSFVTHSFVTLVLRVVTKGECLLESLSLPWAVSSLGDGLCEVILGPQTLTWSLSVSYQLLNDGMASRNNTAVVLFMSFVLE